MKFRRAILFTFGVICLPGCFLRSGFYTYHGDLTGNPVSAPVQIVRDLQGVPHIYADTTEDLFFGLGYAMAQDRLSQIDFFRHVALGKMSEYIGNIPLGKGLRLVQVDMLLKCFELEERGHQAVLKMPPAYKSLLTSFVQGINQFLKDSKNCPPSEYRILGLKPEPWTEAEVLASQELFGLTPNFHSLQTEIIRDIMDHVLGEDRADDFFQLNAGLPRNKLYQDVEQKITSTNDIPVSSDNLLTIARLLVQSMPQGSNNWVVSSDRTPGGFPLLASDPHVPLGGAPSFWYHAHLQGGGYSVEGLLYPGYPAFYIAWNGAVAWSVTNAMVDQIDYYREKLEPHTQDRYKTSEGWKPFVKKEIQCKVRFGRDKRFTLRKGSHGFLLPSEVMKNDILRETPWLQDPFCIRYVETNPAIAFQGFILLAQAHNNQEVKAALKMIGEGAQALNYLWATRQGDIGLHTVGRVPIRDDNQGSKPKKGWLSNVMWQGYIPFDDLPSSQNPPDGILLNANNRIASLDYPRYITEDYVRPSRFNRIRQLLSQKKFWAENDFKDMQSDIFNLASIRTIEALKEALDSKQILDLLKEKEREAWDVLRTWDGETTTTSAGAAVFEVFYLKFLENTFRDELGEDFTKFLLGGMNIIAEKVMDSLLKQPDSPWFDITDTHTQERRNDILIASFKDAVEWCQDEMGQDPKSWSWGNIHILRLEHPFGLLPFIGKPYRVAKVPYPGNSNDTINSGKFIVHDNKYMVIWGAPSRMIIDLANPGGAWFNCSAGMSGDPDSAYFKNLYSDWYSNKYFWTKLAKDPSDQDGHNILVLKP